MHVVDRLRMGGWSDILHNDSGEVKKYVAAPSLKLAARFSWQMSYARLWTFSIGYIAGDIRRESLT